MCLNKPDETISAPQDLTHKIKEHFRGVPDEFMTCEVANKAKVSLLIKLCFSSNMFNKDAIQWVDPEEKKSGVLHFIICLFIYLFIYFVLSLWCLDVSVVMLCSHISLFTHLPWTAPMHFYPLAFQSEGVLSLPSVRLSVRKLYVVHTITRDRFELESPNLHQTYIVGYSRLVLKMEVIDLDLQGHFGHFDSEFKEIRLVRMITHHRFELESPNLHETCILRYSQLVLKMEVIDLDLQGHLAILT